MEDSEFQESDSENERVPDNEILTQKRVDGKQDVKAEEEEEEEHGTEGEQEEITDEEDWHTCSENEGEEEEATACTSNEPSFHNSSRLLRKDDLLDVFKAAHNGPRYKDGQLTVGLVGKKLLLYNLPKRV